MFIINTQPRAYEGGGYWVHVPPPSAKNIPVVLPSSPLKILEKSVKGFMSYDRTSKQTDRQTELTTLYIEIGIMV